MINSKIMKQLLCFMLFTVLFSCNSSTPIDVTQIDTHEMVTILPNLKNPLIKDSIVLSTPIEFKIDIKSSKVSYITWNYIVNGKSLYDDTFDYQVYNKQNKMQPISRLDNSDLKNTKTINIILKERNHLVSKKDAEQLLKKYLITKSLDSLKFGDTIKLTTYNKFKKENSKMIMDLRKVNDSIIFKVTRGEKYFFYLDKKINW